MSKNSRVKRVKEAVVGKEKIVRKCGYYPSDSMVDTGLCKHSKTCGSCKYYYKNRKH